MFSQYINYGAFMNELFSVKHFLYSRQEPFNFKMSQANRIVFCFLLLATATSTIPFDRYVSFSIASNMQLSVYPASRNSSVNRKVQGEEQKIKWPFASQANVPFSHCCCCCFPWIMKMWKCSHYTTSISVWVFFSSYACFVCVVSNIHRAPLIK